MAWRPVPINEPNLHRQQAAAISDVMDAIVELVTNSDDSYRRMGKTEGGRIVIHISREKGGVLRELAVVDWAQGMTREKLMAALKKFEDSSERSQFPGIRGAFGRGLKDTVFAIGQGKIVTRSRASQEPLEARLAWRGGEPRFDDDFAPRPTKGPENAKWYGTIVMAKPDAAHPSEITVPERRTLVHRIPRHYALRDIVRRHQVFLSWKRVTPGAGKMEQSEKANRLRPIHLPGVSVFEQVLHLPTFGEVVLTVYECENPLEGTAGDPWCLYGFTVTSEGVPLDHRVFLDSRSAAPYFWGTIEIPEIGRRLSYGDGASRYSLLSDDRSGLPWRRKPCREELTPAISKELITRFEEKERQLRESAGDAIEALPEERKWLDFLNSRMYAWFGQRSSVVSDPPAGPFDGDPPRPTAPTSALTTLVLAPQIAYVPPGGRRAFSVYVPKDTEGVVHLEVTPGKRAAAEPASLIIRPEMAPNAPAGEFTVTVAAAAEQGQRILIKASLGSETAFAEIWVGEESSRPRGENPQPSARGTTFTGILFDPEPKPTRRVRYDTDSGKIVIYTRYPTVAEVLGRERRRLASPESRVLLAELIAEAVCRAAVLRDKDLPRSVEFARAVDELDRRRSVCLKEIYEFAKAYKA